MKVNCENSSGLLISFLIGMVTLMLMHLWPSLSEHAFAQESKDPLVEHLEFLGYECTRAEQGIRAAHPSKIHLYITFYQGGVRIQTGFPGLDPLTDTGSRFKVLNTLNKEMRVARFYWSEKGHLFGTAWMPGLYEKSRFALFMEAWDQDTLSLRQAYEHLKPFLKPDSQKDKTAEETTS